MKWELKQGKAGDMVRVKVGSIYHYGVFVSEDEIIQFGLAPVARKNIPDSEVCVCVSSVEQFTFGGFLEVGVPSLQERLRMKKPDERISLARSRLGEKGYNILYNNCEHFAYECVLGQKKCTQAEDVREFFRNRPILDVYYADISNIDSDYKGILPFSRQEEIDQVTNLKVKKQKYFVWKLLEYALKRTFGYDIDKINLVKSDSGKWVCDKCYLSLTHSENMVAVALSRSPVGVDAELVKEHNKEYLKRILCQEELECLSALPDKEQNEYLLNKWCEKESIYKYQEERVFSPQKINCKEYNLNTKRLSLSKEDYLLCVCATQLTNLRFLQIDLK